MRLLPRILILLVALANAHCAADSGDYDKELVTPTDSDVGYLLVTVPAATGSKPTAEVEVWLDDTYVLVGIPTPVPVGYGCLSVDNLDIFQMDCDIKVERGVTTTIELALLSVTWEEDSLYADFGPGPAPLEFMRDGHDEAVAYDERFAFRELVPVFPGAYTLKFGAAILPTLERTIAPGEVAHWDITPAREYRAVIEIVPEAASLENAAPPEEPEPPMLHRHVVLLTSEAWDFDDRAVPRPSSFYEHPRPGIDDRSFLGEPFVDWEADFLPDGESRSLLVYPMPEGSPQQYRYWVNGTWIALDVQPGETMRIEPQRVDLANVRVPIPGSAPNEVEGVATIRQLGADGFAPVQMLQGYVNRLSPGPLRVRTNGGLYLAPGLSYEIDVAYPLGESDAHVFYECDPAGCRPKSL